MKKISILFFLIILSCGKKIEADSLDEGFSAPIYSVEIKNLKRQDLSCTEKELGPLEQWSSWERSIYRLIDGLIAPVEIDIKEQMESYQFAATAEKMPFGEIRYGLKTNTIMDFTYSAESEGYIFTQSYEGEILEKDKMIKYCPETNSYERFTYEGMGLSTADSIVKTYNALIDVDANLDLTNIKLELAPVYRYQRRFLGGEYGKTQDYIYETDNAYYNPLTATMSFLPQSLDYYEKGIPPFWEVPVVASHEYGHHVFHLLFNQYRMDEILPEQNQIKHSCFSNKNDKNSFRKNVLANNENKIKKSFFGLQSLNEAYADLIAFYTLPQSMQSLKGLNCFSQNREISFSTFKAGEDKFFSKIGITLLDQDEKEQNENPNCDEIDFQEIHSVGAVISFQVDKLFNKVSVHNKDKLKFLIEWLKTLKEKHLGLTELSSSQYLFHAIELAYFTAIEKSGLPVVQSDLLNSCLVMNTVFDKSINSACLYLKNELE